MALTENGGTTMLVQPSGYGGGGGFGDFGGGWWIILLLLCGWGGMGGMGGFGGGYDFPWLMNGQQGINNNVSSGFRDAMLNDGITSIGDKVTSGFGDVQTALCGGFAGVNATVNNAQNAIAQQLYTNQIADLERSFAAQTANTQGLSSLSGQLAQCCCDNRLATCQTQNIVQNEAAATRAASAANTQAILDKLCALEIDGLKDQNQNLRTMVNMQNLAASQAAQTAALIADNTEQTKYIVNRVAPYPIPSYTVPNPFAPAI